MRAFDFPGLSAADGRMLAVNHYVKPGANTLETKPFRLVCPKVVVVE